MNNSIQILNLESVTVMATIIYIATGNDIGTVGSKHLSEALTILIQLTKCFRTKYICYKSGSFKKSQDCYLSPQMETVLNKCASTSKLYIIIASCQQEGSHLNQNIWLKKTKFL
jgi:hypothetical protein